MVVLRVAAANRRRRRSMRELLVARPERRPVRFLRGRAFLSARPFVLPSLSATLLTAQQSAVDRPKQQTTFYPPSVYMQSFIACSSDGLCTRTENFRVDPLPNGCCTLTVTNGDGQRADEVRSYEVFLNGTKAISTDHSRFAKATVKLRLSNILKVILGGRPSSKVFVLVAYEPRQSK